MTMNKTKNILKTGLCLLALGAGMTACNPEVDESNLYTETQLNIEGWLQQNDNLSSFNYILARVGYDRVMNSYGHYTCFAPVNEGVQQYIDSLYRDTEGLKPRNGMDDHGTLAEGQHIELEWLTDSLCRDIAEYHLTNGKYDEMYMRSKGTEGMELLNMQGRTVKSSTDSLGNTVLEKSTTDPGAIIIDADIDTLGNGIIHVLDRVIPRNTRLMATELFRHAEYSIFYRALVETGLADSLMMTKKLDENGMPRQWSDDEMNGDDVLDTDNARLYYPKECKLGYTIFAESDAVLAKNNIKSFDDLVAYANKQYADAAGWYQMLSEKGLWNADSKSYVKSVSTGTDYRNRNNALNMFVAYHIVKCAMANTQLVFENTPGLGVATSKWNYINGGEPYDYYETMLPHTLLKIWQPQPGRVLFINRYQTNNTLTNELATMGTNHVLIRQGVRVNREGEIKADNGYLQAIEGMLVYDKEVPQGVLNERLRFEATTFLPEFINNGFRYMLNSTVSDLNNGGSGARIAFPRDYFDNVVCYNDGCQLRYNVKGNFRAYQADAFQGWGQSYDLAIRIPPVPTGHYEFRLFYSPMGHGGFMQFYLGKSSSPASMEPLSIPLDVRIEAADARIGWTKFYEEEDHGINSDVEMHNRGYMRGPYSFQGHPGEYDEARKTTDWNCRGDATVTLRRVLGRIDVKQSEDYWFRIKSVDPDLKEAKWQLDFIELVPTNVVDNDQYSEDWF